MTKDKLLEIYNNFKEENIDTLLIRQLRKCSDQEIDIIMNSFYKEVTMQLIINNEFKLLNKEQQTEIVRLLNNAKTEEVAYGIYRIASSGMILSSRLTTEIAKIIDNSTLESSLYIIDLALTNSFLINPKALEIIKIIGSFNNEYQAKTASEIAKSIAVLSNENIIEIIKITSQVKNEIQAAMIKSLAKNREILSSNLTIKIIILANELEDEQKILITKIAENTLLEKNNRTIYYIVKMLESKLQINQIYEQAQKEILHLKQNESIIKKDKDLFWNEYRKNPIEAIEAIKISSEKIVTPMTKVKKK